MHTPHPSRTRRTAISNASADLKSDFREQIRLAKIELISTLSGVGASAFGMAGVHPAQLLGELPPNIVGIGVGAADSNVQTVEAPVLRVYVRAKQPKSAVPVQERVPSKINGMSTDLIEVGDLSARLRATSGVSVAHKSVTAGTIGCLVTMLDGTPGEFILSNNHVLANCNACAVGDDIIEPGPLDGGTVSIATLTAWKDLDFARGAINDIDAAIAEVTVLGDVNSVLPVIGAMQSPHADPVLYQSVRKHGRTTLHTVGVIMDISADIKVRYGVHIAEFSDQIAIIGVGTQFSDGGDSGSVIVDAVTKQPVGLLFAGGGATTFANPISTVLNHFGVGIVY